MSEEQKTRSPIAIILIIFICLGGLVFWGMNAKKKDGPDLIVQKVRVKHGSQLKMGLNTIEVYVKNVGKKEADSSFTRLEIRKGRNKPDGKLVGKYDKKTASLKKGKRTKVVFKKVNIPQTEEEEWYTLVGIADVKNEIKETKEKNNKKHKSKVAQK